MVELELTFDGAVPTLEYEVCRALVEHALPGLSDEQVVDILARRGATKPQRFNIAVGSDDLEALADILDEADLEDAKNNVRSYHQQVQAQKDRVEALRAKAKARAKKPRQVPAHEHATLEKARRLVPEVPGCSLHLEENWHLRWRAQYPSEFPPFSCSRSFQSDHSASKRKALFEVCAWLWSQHKRATGEACPWNFEPT